MILVFYMYVYVVEVFLFFLKKGLKVLDVGSGSGYMMVIFWYLIKDDDELKISVCVIGIDYIKFLVELVCKNL